MAALYSVFSSDPPELVRSLSGLPCTVAQSMCSLELTCPKAAVLQEISISAIAHYVNVAGGRYEPRRAPVDVVVAPPGTSTLQKDNASCTSCWRGSSQVGDGESFLVTFTIAEPGTCLMGSCHIEVRDISLKLCAVASTLRGQLSALFNNEALLPPGDAVTVRFADPKAPPLVVSKFVLQLRSPVFRAEFSSRFREVDSQELSLDDFPPSSVGAFLEMLHSDDYNGEQLDPEEIVALFALGDKYDVPFVLEYVLNDLATRCLSPEELQAAFLCATRHQAPALRAMLSKRLRWLPEDELCQFLDIASPAGGAARPPTVT